MPKSLYTSVLATITAEPIAYNFSSNNISVKSSSDLTSLFGDFAYSLTLYEKRPVLNIYNPLSISFEQATLDASSNTILFGADLIGLDVKRKYGVKLNLSLASQVWQNVLMDGQNQTFPMSFSDFR